jgi:segregation and condensation protein A
MVDQDYKVRLDVFEGPLDLLLYLIKREEVDIYDVSLEKITKHYLEFIEAFQALDIELAGEFIVMAATLLYIKSRTLLPADQQLPDEEEEGEDPKWELIRQLIEYKKFKEAADRLRERESLQEALFPRAPVVPDLAPENLLVEEVSIFDLINAFQKILKRLSKEKEPEDLREIFAENFTVGEKIEVILQRISSGVSLRFDELFAQSASRAEVVVTFLAMLELIRMKQLRVRQEQTCGEIWLDKSTDFTPLFQKPTPTDHEG